MEKHVSKVLQLLRNGASISTDSRKLKPGDIFVALKGDYFNGNKFAADAVKNGCRLAIIDDLDHNLGADYLLVENALDFLQETARHYRRSLSMPVLAITGTNGKTTTKELTHAVMAQFFVSQATQGNLNNHIGVPLTLLDINEQVEIAVVEMGANHVGEIAALCELAMPTHAIITNIGKAHLEGFGSVENIEKAKSELFQYVAAKNGKLFVNCDDQRLKKHASHKNAITYGACNECHCSGYIKTAFPFVEVSFSTNKPFGKAAKGIHGSVKSRLTGSYNFSNIMAAVTAGLFFGVPVNHIVNAIEKYQPQNNRSQIIHTANNTIVMDAYNANPTSMAAALENFAHFKTKPKAVMLGDMLELGNDAESEHKTIVELVQQGDNQLQLFVGEHFSTTAMNDSNALVFKSVDDAANWLKNHPLRGYHILIKGSRGIKMENLLNIL